MPLIMNISGSLKKPLIVIPIWTYNIQFVSDIFIKFVWYTFSLPQNNININGKIIYKIAFNTYNQLFDLAAKWADFLAFVERCQKCAVPLICRLSLCI